MFDAITDTNASLQNIPSQCNVTTMTFVATLSHRDLRVTEGVIADLGALEDPYFTSIGPSAFSQSALEFHSLEMPSVKIKLFNIGALQITGCKSHVQAMHSIIETCRVLSTYIETPVEAIKMETVLINVNIQVHDGVNLTKFACAARARTIFAEQPERPPSCILKVPGTKMTTAMMYKSGKCTICAGTPQDIARTYALVMNILEHTPHIMEPRTNDVIRRDRGQFTWPQLVQCGMPGILHTHPPTTHEMVDDCPCCRSYGNWLCRVKSEVPELDCGIDGTVPLAAPSAEE